MFSIQDTIFADNGYFVNLDSSVDRLNHINNQIKNFNIQGLHRFPALTDEMIQCSATKSQTSVFREALSEGYKTIFIGEDDFDILDKITDYDGIIRSAGDHLGILKQELDALNWDVFLFGCTPRSYLIPYTKNISKVYKSTGAWAYLIKDKAMRYILDNFEYKKDYLAIDDILPILNWKGFNTFCSSPITIHHAKNFESTLNPRGPVNYDNMINGHYEKFLENNLHELNNYVEAYNLERELTIVIAGHFVENYLFYLKYLLHSLPDSLKKCQFLIYYDRNPNIENPILELIHYFYNHQSDISYNIKFVQYGLIDTVKHMLSDINTPYFLFLEHDWVFLNKNNINFNKLIDVFNKYSFINSVYFNKDDNQMRGFEICKDREDNVTPFAIEDRVSELNLITTCRWSNNPCIHRTSKYIEWYNKYLDKIHNNVGHGQHDVEEVMIPTYRKEIENNLWCNIKDNWGTYLYGDIGDDAYVAHTDASRRYLYGARSQPEINGDNYIINNPL